MPAAKKPAPITDLFDLLNPVEILLSRIADIAGDIPPPKCPTCGVQDVDAMEGLEEVGYNAEELAYNISRFLNDWGELSEEQQQRLLTEAQVPKTRRR